MFASSSLRKYFAQFLAVYTASLGPISNGMEFGWASPAIPILSSKDISPVYIDHDNSFWVQSLYIIGGVCGVPVTFCCLQYLGRKKSLLGAQCVTFTCWILIATAATIEQLFVARFVAGMAANMVFVGLPMYTAEVAEARIRGFLGSFVYTQSIFGVLLSYAIVPFVPIWASSALGASLSLLMIATFMWQPESPYFLLLKGKKESAGRELKRLRSSSVSVDEELVDMCAAVQRQSGERGRPIDLLVVTSNRKAVVIMTVLNSAQNLAGMTVVTMNIQTILQQSATSAEGVQLSAEMSAILFGVTMVVSTVLGSLLIDRFGRKVLLISSCLFASFFIAVLAVFFYLKEHGGAVDVSAVASWLPLFATVAYAFSFKYGMGLVPIIVTAELFPTSVKSMGMVMSDLWFTLMATVSIKLYYVTNDLYGMHVPFAIFAAFGICTAIFVAVYVPETKGKTLEQIQMILKTGQDDHNKVQGDIIITNSSASTNL